MARKAVSLPPAIEITPAGPVHTSSRREISEGLLPAWAISGRTPDQTETMSARVRAGMVKLRAQVASR